MGRSKPEKGAKAQKGEASGPEALLDFARIVTAGGAKSTTAASTKALKASQYRDWAVVLFLLSPLASPIPGFTTDAAGEWGILHRLNLN